MSGPTMTQELMPVPYVSHSLSGYRLGCATAVEQDVERADDESDCQRWRADGTVQRHAALPLAAAKRGRDSRVTFSVCVARGRGSCQELALARDGGHT